MYLTITAAGNEYWVLYPEFRANLEEYLDYQALLGRANSTMNLVCNNGYICIHNYQDHYIQSESYIPLIMII